MSAPSFPLQYQLPSLHSMLPTVPGASTTFTLADASNQMSVKFEMTADQTAAAPQEVKPVPQIRPADDTVLHAHIEKLLAEISQLRGENARVKNKYSDLKRKYDALRAQKTSAPQQTFAVPVIPTSSLQSGMQHFMCAPVGSERKAASIASSVSSLSSDRKRRRHGEAPSVAPSTVAPSVAASAAHSVASNSASFISSWVASSVASGVGRK